MRALPAPLKRQIAAFAFVYRRHIPDVFAPSAVDDLRSFYSLVPERDRCALRRGTAVRHRRAAAKSGWLKRPPGLEASTKTGTARPPANDVDM
jgi:hypothetical protein